MTTKQF